MESPRDSLARLRERVARSRDADEIDALRSALAHDPRAGARGLLDRLERRLQGEARESERLAALFALRARLRAQGHQRIAGVDEVGVGPLAGPVVACAVVLADDCDLPGLDDSKRVPPARREELDRRIRAQALAVCVAEVAAEEIDRIDIFRATLEAMRRAVLGLAPAADHVLVDARTIPGIAAPQTAIVHGDRLDASIAAASIVAKVHRDRLMDALDVQHPEYGFALHKGYPTPQHLAALARFGPSAVHRRSFAPVARSL